jgi:hypothetical protein
VGVARPIRGDKFVEDVLGEKKMFGRPIERNKQEK